MTTQAKNLTSFSEGIADNGNVGIGTTSPDEKLHIEATNPQIRLLNNSTGLSGLEWWNDYGGVDHVNTSINWNEGSANWEFKSYRADSQANNPYGNIDFYNGSTTSPSLALRITTGGKIGIGTETPRSHLQVVSNTGRNDGGSARFGKRDIIGGLFLHSDASTSSHYNWMITTQDTVNQGFEIIPSSAPGNIEFSTPAFVITGDDRNVGIGTSGPGEKLHVEGSIRASGNIGVTQTDGDYLAKLYQSSADGFLELYTGNATPISRVKLSSYGDSYIAPSTNSGLGIGTAAPDAKLHVMGGIIAGVADTANSNYHGLLGTRALGSGLGGYGIHYASGFENPIIWGYDNGDNGGKIRFATMTSSSDRTLGNGLTDRMVIETGTGNVGIGTDDPSASLQVGNAADQQEWITVNSLGGYYSGIKLARGAGDWSSTGNNNYGMLVTDGGFEISKFTNKGNNTNGRDAFLVLDDTEVNVEKPFGLLSATSDPTGTRAGQLYYNSSGQKVKFYNGSTWQDVSSDGIIKSNLLLHWDMTNSSSYSGSGSTVNDISGNGYNGTIQGNPTYSSSNNGYMIFDGYGDYITSSLTQPAGARAFGMWVYYSSATQPAGEGFQLQGVQAGGGYTYQGIQNGGNVYFYIGTGTGGPTSHQLSSGQWYYQVLTFDGSNYAIYVNGSLIQSGSASSGTTSSTFQAGAINANHRLYGYGSEWQFYGQNLTSAEVQQNFNAGRGRYGI